MILFINNYMQDFVDSTDDVPSNLIDTVLKYLENLKTSFNMVKENISLIH